MIRYRLSRLLAATIASTAISIIAHADPPTILWNATDKNATLTLPGNIEMKFVWIPPGEFTMGSPANEEGRRSDETQHRVTLTKGFWLGTCEVTQAQWRSVMGADPKYLRNVKGDNLPVEQVPWNECQEFIAKLNSQGEALVRLPTEAEWEYACRAGTTTAYSFGPDATNLDDYAWHPENSGEGTHPVGQKKPNAWGLYDMHGNVWEWCADWSGDYPTDAVTDPTGPASGTERVLRGGSRRADADYLRSAYHAWTIPRDMSGYYVAVGLRLARTVSLAE